MNPSSWLPPLVTFADYGGDWTAYLAAIYAFFTKDFVEDRPSFRGERLALKRHPVILGKEATFWHLISEGRDESERTPDFRRCERIRWPRPIVEAAQRPTLKVWRNERRGEERICLWAESDEYLVVLARRKGYLLLWTAYAVTEPHQKRKLEREFCESTKS